MTSTGPDNETTGNSGTTGASASSSSGRSRRRRRRQVHRRAAPPSTRVLEQADGTRGTGDPARRGDRSPADRPSRDRPTRLPKTFHGDIPDAGAAPFISLTIATSGIHPTTSRLVGVAAVLYDAEGNTVPFTGNRPACSDVGRDVAGDVAAGGAGTADAAAVPADGTVELTGVVQQINPGEDPGPWHLHGYTEADLGQAPGFATVAPLLYTLLDGRTLICHGTAVTWGFIVQEFRRAQRAANRSGAQSGGRGRRRSTRRPRRINVPVPERIVDTLATARRQSVPVEDPRLRSIAGYYRDHEGLELPVSALPALGAAASEARSDTGADELLLADARILMPLHLVQEDLADAGRGTIQSSVPADLTADRFGLQRSAVRVDATTAPRPFGNPGVPESTHPGSLVEGMEFVVSPDVATDPDVLISAGLREGLVYSEKLNRTSSLVVCNANHALRGKAMHAHRKNIPLFSDEEFLAALEDVAPGSTTLEDPDPRPATPRIPAPQRGGHGRGRNRKGGGKPRDMKKQGAKKQGGRVSGGQGGKSAGQASPKSTAESPEGGPSRDGAVKKNRKRSRNRGRRRGAAGSRGAGSTRSDNGQQNRQDRQDRKDRPAQGGATGPEPDRSAPRRRRRSGADRQTKPDQQR